MKIFKIYSLLFLSFLTFCSCKQKSNKNENFKTTTNLLDNDSIFQLNISEMEINDIKTYLAQTIKFSNDYPVTEKDIELSIPIMEQNLKNNNFKILSANDFEKKIIDLFKLDKFRKDGYSIIDFQKYYICSTVDYDNLVSEMNNDDKKENNELLKFSESNIIFIKNLNFISEPLQLRKIVSEMNGNLTPHVPPQIIHRNKYFFNNSKSSLTWLINNDLNFLDLLVSYFGYDKDNRINEFVLNKRSRDHISLPHNTVVYDNLFAKRYDFDMSAEIRENLLKYIVENSTVEKPELVGLLFDYGTNILLGQTDFSKSDKCKIIAYIGYYEQLARRKNNIDNPESPDYTPKGWYQGSFLREAIIKDMSIVEYIKKSNYYGLSGLEDMISVILDEIE